MSSSRPRTILSRVSCTKSHPRLREDWIPPRGLPEICDIPLTIEFEPHELFRHSKPSVVAQMLADRDEDDSKKSDPAAGKGSLNVNPPNTCEIKALVYVSGIFKDDGVTPEEYILRMQKAVIDAQKLGVFPTFVERVIGPQLVTPGMTYRQHNIGIIGRLQIIEPSSPPKGSLETYRLR